MGKLHDQCVARTGRRMSVIVELLSPGAISAALPFSNSKALFQHLGQVAAREYGLDAGIVVERLTERERLGSTGFGKGVAIPHGKIEGLDHVVGIFVRLEKGIDFKSVDDNPVDIVFCLLSPPDSGSAHLKALAQVSRWLRDSKFVAKLRGAGSPDSVYALFDALDTRDAA
jgi:nitrogen PTS system EIIA component